MTKHVALAVTMLLMASGAAFSQSSPSPHSGSSNGMHPAHPQGGAGGDSAQFQMHKAEILQRINERLAELQQRQNCVEAANNRDALRACIQQEKAQH